LTKEGRSWGRGLKKTKLVPQKNPRTNIVGGDSNRLRLTADIEK